MRKCNLLIDGLLIYAIYESQTTRKRTRTAGNNHLTEKYPTFWAKNWDTGKKAPKKWFLAKTRSLWGDFLGGALMKYLS